MLLCADYLHLLLILFFFCFKLFCNNSIKVFTYFLIFKYHITSRLGSIFLDMNRFFFVPRSLKKKKSDKREGGSRFERNGIYKGCSNLSVVPHCAGSIQQFKNSPPCTLSKVFWDFASKEHVLSVSDCHRKNHKKWVCLYSIVSGSLWTKNTWLLIRLLKRERHLQHGHSLFQGSALLRTSYFLFYCVGF